MESKKEDVKPVWRKTVEDQCVQLQSIQNQYCVYGYVYTDAEI